MNFSFLYLNMPFSKLVGIVRGSMLLAFLLASPSAFAIKKCQDEEGQWHYGDTAVHECEKSKVTTLDNRGFIRDQNEAPKTEEELAAEQSTRAKIEAEEKKLSDEKEERNRLLSIYQTEADIDRQLDNQIYSVESSIAVHNVYLKGMARKIERLEAKKPEQNAKRAERTQAEIDASLAKIKESEEELKNLEMQKTQIQERFAREKELFKAFNEEGNR